MSNPLFDAIVFYGEKYREKHVNKTDRDKLMSNFWPALDFFLSRACFQGRRDEVSEKVYKAAIEVLEPEFSRSDQTTKYRTHQQQGWTSLDEILRNKIGKGHVGKARDVDMVLSALDFISQLSDLNLVKHSVEQIRQGNLSEHCTKLRASNGGITQVGPKIAALYLRDVISLYNLDDKVSADSAYCVQPVDTWVRKLAYRLKIVDGHANDLKIQRAIVRGEIPGT